MSEYPNSHIRAEGGTAIAVIPARGGSKRIPRKNVKEFCGKPMIAWSIEETLKSGLFDHVIVSTDDEEIATIAKEYGAEVPFMRPLELSDDHTSLRPVVNHAITEATQLWGAPDFVCAIYATAPFIISKDLIEGLNILLQHQETTYVFGGTSFGFPIFRSLKVNENGNGAVTMFWPEHELTRSQDLPEAYHDAGQFYWGSPPTWANCTSIFNSGSRIVKLPRYRVQDIDTEEDWERAALLFEVLNQREGA